MLEADDEGEILDEDTEGGRPDDCDCWDAKLSCWPCYRAGFKQPATTDDNDEPTRG